MRYMSHHLESYEVNIIYVDIPYHSKEKSCITSQTQKHIQSLHKCYVTISNTTY